MTDPIPDSDTEEVSEPGLQKRIERLESKSLELERQAERRIILAELKVEALRAGMLDLDGLTFLDPNQVELAEDGSIAGGAELIARLKHSKPWLFLAPSSSSTARVPSSRPNRQKLATEMSEEEYRSARANIIRRSAL